MSVDTFFVFFLFSLYLCNALERLHSVDTDVVIVGAGAAGIAAAMELKKTSLSFVVLEARNRVGGRAFTDHETFTPTPVDLGANWIHFFQPDNPMYTYYEEFKKDNHIKTIEQKEKYLNLDYDGKPIPSKLLKRAEAIYEKILTYLEKFADYSENKEDRSIEDVIKAEYDRLVEPESEIKHIVDGFLAELEEDDASDLTHLSAKQWGLTDEKKTSDQWVSFGCGKIFEHIVNKYNLPIQLNTVVTHIDTQDINRIAISTLANGPPIFCRRVIVTIPLGCLKRGTIIFKPPLPDWKHKAISQMGFGLMNKFFLQFSYRFWDKTTTIIKHVSKQERGRFLYTVCLPPPANILILLVTGTFARELETLTDSEILKQVMDFIRQIFPQSLVPDPVKYKFTRWAKDPFAYGSYSNYAVHSNRRTVKLLAKDTADGRVFWAGEHTNINDDYNEWDISYLHSAVLSGQRAAIAIENQLDSSL